MLDLAPAPACTCHDDAEPFPVAPTSSPARKPAMHTPHTPVPFPTNPAAAALQSAAGLVGHCPGVLNLSIEVGGYDITIRPSRDRQDREHDGAAPATSSTTATSATTAGAVTSKPATAGPSRNELLRLLFSADESSILRVMIGKEAYKASDVMIDARLEKSKFWVLWSNLQHRGIVGDVEQGEGFCILPPWVAEHVAVKPNKPVTSTI
jgi:hypothetical protein